MIITVSRDGTLKVFSHSIRWSMFLKVILLLSGRSCFSVCLFRHEFRHPPENSYDSFQCLLSVGKTYLKQLCPSSLSSSLPHVVKISLFKHRPSFCSSFFFISELTGLSIFITFIAHTCGASPGQFQRQRDCGPRTHNILVPITIDFTIGFQQDVVLLLIYLMCKSIGTLAWLVHAKTIKSKMWTSSSCRRFEILPVNCGSRRFTTVSKALLSIIKKKKVGLMNHMAYDNSRKLYQQQRASNVCKRSEKTERG